MDAGVNTNRFFSTKKKKKGLRDISKITFR